jgi:hypothetical protein
MLALGVHTWTARAYNVVGYSAWATPSWTVEITNPADLAAPTSSVDPLPVTSTIVFTVSWTGDDYGGSGIDFYDVYVSTGGGPFEAWKTGFSGAQARFTGTVGTTYGFYSIATDKAGNRQETPPGAQASTTVWALCRTPLLLAPPDGTSTVVTQTTFTWQAGEGVTPDGYNLDLDGVVITTTGTTTSAVLAVGPHTWTVRAFNAIGYSDWADPSWSIEVLDPYYHVYLPLTLRQQP